MVILKIIKLFLLWIKSWYENKISWFLVFYFCEIARIIFCRQTSNYDLIHVHDRTAWGYTSPSPLKVQCQQQTNKSTMSLTVETFLIILVHNVIFLYTCVYACMYEPLWETGSYSFRFSSYLLNYKLLHANSLGVKLLLWWVIVKLPIH